jgi:ketosteroid isomerase-like protein
MNPQRNVKRLRRYIEAYNAHDIEAYLACFDPRAEFQSVFAAVGGATYRGHAELRRYLRDLTDAWGDEIRIEPETLFDLGEHTLLFHTFHGRGRQSGAEVAMPLALVARWRNGLIVSMKSYVDREDALRDLGVSEDELEPIAP